MTRLCGCSTGLAKAAVAAGILVALLAAPSSAGGLFQPGAVGGVMINADGLVSNPETTELRDLQATWQAGLDEIPGDLTKFSPLRFVSLKGLEDQIAESRDQLLPLPDAVRYLAGLQRVQYILVYPERQDIVLAGPAEGWRIDSLGNVVGISTGRPVLMLDDLMVALRTGETSRRTGMSCSIDPTPEGLQRVRGVAEELVPGMTPETASRRIEDALGKQVVSVTGVPPTSHFARAMVAADFRMKRLGMNFEPAPIDGLPSYLEMASTGTRGMPNLLPRWWLAADYDSVLRDNDGLAWEIRGQGVMCMTEQDLLSEGGDRTQTGKADAVAQRWADNFTKHFEELANEDSAFGHLRNIMDLAVVGAIISKYELLQRAGLEIPRLLVEEPLDRYHAPRHVASKASFVKKRRGWLISASGGVQVSPWQIADKTETDDQKLADVREGAVDKQPQRWWWQ